MLVLAGGESFLFFPVYESTQGYTTHSMKSVEWLLFVTTKTMTLMKYKMLVKQAEDKISNPNKTDQQINQQTDGQPNLQSTNIQKNRQTKKP